MAASNTIAFSPAIRNNMPYTTSVSHSQANHGAEGREKENRSWVGTARWSSTYSPTRICQPASPSISSAFQPLAPATNSQTKTAMKKKSERDGISALPQAAFITRLNRAVAGRICTGEIACGELAKTLNQEFPTD